MSRLLRSALDLADAGWAVLPLDGKKPITRHGHKDATTDRRTIRKWWAEGEWNIGSPVPPSLLVLDVDPRNGGDLRDLELRAGVQLPPTLEVVSGRRDGGRHLYYMRPFVQPHRGSVPRGIDVKINGYMVMPPSVHPDSGKPYRWATREVATLPREVIKLMLPRRGSKPKTPTSASPVALASFVRGLQSGERHDGLFWAASRAHEAGVGDRGLQQLIDAAEDNGFSRSEAERVVLSARKEHRA